MQDWVTLITTVLGAGAGAALVQPLITLWQDRRQRKANAAYMAMRVAVTLEAYAAECCEFITENSLAETALDSEYPDWNAGLPELPAYPDDAAGWRAINRKLAGRALGFRDKITGSQSTIRWAIECDEDDLGFVLNREACKCGLEALDIAAYLRHAHDVEDDESGGNWRRHLKKAFDRAERELTRQESNFLSPEPQTDPLPAIALA